MRPHYYPSVRALVLLSLLMATSAISQSTSSSVDSPDKKTLFEEDTKEHKKALEEEQKKILSRDPAGSGFLNFSAPTVEFLKEGNVVRGSGGVLIAGEGVSAQAEKAQVNQNTKDATLEGGVLFSGISGEISAEKAAINFDSETGKFDAAEFSMSDGDYFVRSSEATKLSEYEYELEESEFFTCRCGDGSRPWSVGCSRAHITEEGYAHTYNTKIQFHEFPVLYSPYFVFPVKRERSSGLLAPSFGISNKDGFQTRLPLFVVLDDSTDLTLTPFIETETRVGSELNFRKAFSERHNLDLGLLYSDESLRDESLRGVVYVDPKSGGAPITSLSQLSSPDFSQDRFGGYLSESWKSEESALLPSAFIIDGHYVSDDLYLRELPNDRIGDPRDRYLISTALLRTGLGEYAYAEALGEYNQLLDATDDDLVFQRGPQLSLAGSKSFRPFGFNPLGIKVNTGLGLTATNFVRQEGYDGWRYDVNPTVGIPLRVSNYLQTQATFGWRHTSYSLNETANPAVSGEELDSSTDRQLYTLGYDVSSALERVYELEQDSLLRSLTSLGAQNQESELLRVKHVLEPKVSYLYVPERDQAENPFFDSLDRYGARSLVTYGLDNTIYGRFLPRSAVDDNIPDLAPRVEDLPTAGIGRIAGDISGFDDSSGLGNSLQTKRGTIRKLMNFGVRQSYDLNEERQDLNPDRNSFSDLGFYAGLFPTQNFGLQLDNNYNAENNEISSWHIGTTLTDDRGDALRARYSYVKDYSVTAKDIDQIEGNLEIKLIDRLRIGYYASYDNFANEFFENRVALRLKSPCDCWSVDLGYSETLNPDKETFLLRFTFKGLGDISQNVFSRRPENNSAG